MNEKPFKDIIRKITGADFSEPTEEPIAFFKEQFRCLFDAAGYSREGIHAFDTVLEWMARYQLAIIDHEKCERTARNAGAISPSLRPITKAIL